jgi:hypothetical protein
VKKLFFLLLLIIICGCNNVENQDRIHLQFLGVSISDYMEVNKKLPSNITDKEGKPLLSWRLELLKHGSSKELDLYKQFKLDEPWNSPHNLKVAQTVPFMYVDPKGPKCTPVDPIPNSILLTMNPKTPNFTPYLGVSGPTAAFRPNNPRNVESKSQISHAAIVIVDKSDVFWTEPRDISLEKVKNGECIRWYGNKTIYLTTNGITCDWERNKDVMNHPPNYEFESGE